MKKLLAGLAAVAALSSTAAVADTPVVRELNDFSHIQAVAGKNREATKPSEFVIYHQDSHRPCPPEHHEHGRMMHHHGKPEHKGEHRHEHKHAGEHHHHHHHHDAKKDKDAAKADKKPAVNEQDQKPGDQ